MSASAQELERRILEEQRETEKTLGRSSGELNEAFLKGAVGQQEQLFLETLQTAPQPNWDIGVFWPRDGDQNDPNVRHEREKRARRQRQERQQLVFNYILK